MELDASHVSNNSSSRVLQLSSLEQKVDVLAEKLQAGLEVSHFQRLQNIFPIYFLVFRVDVMFVLCLQVKDLKSTDLLSYYEAKLQSLQVTLKRNILV